MNTKEIDSQVFRVVTDAAVRSFDEGNFESSTYSLEVALQLVRRYQDSQGPSRLNISDANRTILVNMLEAIERKKVPRLAKPI